MTQVKIALPPKRWESADDSRYDSIRPTKWFQRLQKRKHHTPMLQQAYNQWLQIGHITTQQQVCETWGVSTREFRDYLQFKEGTHQSKFSKTQQAIMDEAYSMYSLGNGSSPWRKCLEIVASSFGDNPRHIVELWETSPFYLPTNYRER